VDIVTCRNIKDDLIAVGFEHMNKRLLKIPEMLKLSSVCILDMLFNKKTSA